MASSTDTGGTKYSVDRRSRWRWNSGFWLSEHAADRWDERTPPDSISPEAAFEISEPIEHPELLTDEGGQVPDDVRVYDCHDYKVAFIVRDGTIMTIYDLDTVEYGPLRAYLMSFGPHPEVDHAFDA